ncbi:alkene reductase [Duganella aceris]|uniref:Alkene reductase n=1 Tax=Duganella aceris TaxID=2703883 RepID=A0ABX0FKP9_9BURK|nr:alkene reductase [Duganella aceris]NGZ85096.1 alkene reductase [Duganella aceris]
MSKLFSPFQLGRYTLQHRVVHAPTTRLRANPDDSPSDLMVEYYSQRASAGGLIITESTHVSYDSRGYLGAPGIYEDSHMPGWRKIADAVHAKGGVLFMQLGHDGRQSHVDLTGGPLPIAPSVVPFETNVLTQDGWVPASPHRAVDVDEIDMVIEYYRNAAIRAKAAGLDGVELHSANGYLADTFLQDGTNKRTDAYGGTREKRTRFLLEVVEALVSVWGADRVGVRLSPSGQWGSIFDSDPEATFSYAAQQLNKFGLAYLHIIEPRVKGVETLDEHQLPVASEFMRQSFSGPIISAGGFNGDGAEAIVAKGDADLVAFGRFFASNPDLPYRLQHRLPLNEYDREAFWGGTHVGYTDYPVYQASDFAGVA